MMAVAYRVVPNCYRDSVVLLDVSARLAALAGVWSATVTMATPANVAAATDLGIAGPVLAQPNDVLIVVGAEADVATGALDQAVSWLVAPAPSAASLGAGASPVRTLRKAAARGAGVALISVPGAFAAAEARKALDVGMHVMIFSDNVPVAQERALKDHAGRLGLLVMGPDCGTAVLDGIPLGFANALRRGPVGLVGASGSGLQEVSTGLHRLGGGVSQLIGTGGRDLSEAVGGLATMAALELLATDPRTEIIVVVSKPAPAAIARRVVELAVGSGKPVVAALLGTDPAVLAGCGALIAQDLDQAARLTAQLSGIGLIALDGPGATGPFGVTGPFSGGGFRPGWLRGLFSGGTLGYEAQLVLGAQGVVVASNAAAPGQRRLADLDLDGGRWLGHVVLDLGADEFTHGRPHPMIDPRGRDALLADCLAEDGVGVVLFDVVLGYGAAADPVGGVVELLGGAASRAGSTGFPAPGNPGGPRLIAHVCGTDEDPQRRRLVVDALRGVGVLVAHSNAQAARWAAQCLDPTSQGLVDLNPTGPNRTSRGSVEVTG